MAQNFFGRQLQRHREWWRAPVTPKDRLAGTVVGGVACFWFGLLGRVMLGPTPVSLASIAAWALGVAVAGALIGFIFPKVTTTLGFPFSTFGIGSGT